MLTKLREMFSGWVSKVVFGLLVFVFSFFGIESYFVARTDTFVAKVNGHEVSQQDFRTAMDNFRQRALQQSGGKLDGSYFEKPEVKRQVLDALIDRQLVLQAGDKLGAAVSDAQVRDAIAAIPAFQIDGKFDDGTYRAVLASQGMSPLTFQERVRSDLQAEVLPQAIGASALATDADVDAYLRLRGQTRDIRYALLPAPAVGDGAVSDDEIAAYYKAHPSDFMNPETVALQYLELNAADLKVDATVDDESLRKRYEEEKQRFVLPEQRLVSHILVKVPANATPAQQKAALEKAQKLDAEAKAPGADFAKLAEQYSDDLGSRRQGGDLGWISKGETDPAFESALFALQKGQISAPVLSSEGYHVIWLRDVRSGQAKPFEEVKDDLAKQMLDSERERKFSEVAGKLTDLIYQDPSSLEPAAKALGLTIQTTPPFTRSGGAGIAANPKVVEAAFSNGVLVEGNTSDPVELGPNHIVVVHVAKHTPATPKPLAEVRDVIRQRVLTERAEAAAKQRADALYAKLRQDGDLAAVAAEAGVQVQTAAGVGRDAQQPDAALVEAVFRMPYPAGGKPGTALVPLAHGAFALVALDAVHAGDPAKVAPAERAMLRQQLARLYGTEAAREFIAALRSGAKIDVAEDRMQ